MLQKKPRWKGFLVSISLFLLVFIGVFALLLINRPVGINELWKKVYSNKNLEGKDVIVQGDILFEPLSGFHFYDVYLLDPETPNEYRTHDYAIWFGVGLADIHCFVDNGQKISKCQPIDPTAASEFKFKGTVHFASIGKKEIMWLSDIDFENSRQLIDGNWVPIPIGEFVIPFESE